MRIDQETGEVADRSREFCFSRQQAPNPSVITSNKLQQLQRSAFAAL
jgi:hypothetical protein